MRMSREKTTLEQQNTRETYLDEKRAICCVQQESIWSSTDRKSRAAAIQNPLQKNNKESNFDLEWAGKIDKLDDMGLCLPNNQRRRRKTDWIQDLRGGIDREAEGWRPSSFLVFFFFLFTKILYMLELQYNEKLHTYMEYLFIYIYSVMW